MASVAAAAPAPAVVVSPAGRPLEGGVGRVLDAVVGVEAGLVLLGQLGVLLQRGLADHRVWGTDGVAALGGVGQGTNGSRAAEQAGVDQGPLRLPGRPVHVDGLDLAHRLVVGGQRVRPRQERAWSIVGSVIASSSAASLSDPKGR